MLPGHPVVVGQERTEHGDVVLFLNDAAPPDLYPLPQHAALPIAGAALTTLLPPPPPTTPAQIVAVRIWLLVRSDRKSTRLNSSHSQISHAVFCLNKNS